MVQWLADSVTSEQYNILSGVSPQLSCAISKPAFLVFLLDTPSTSLVFQPFNEKGKPRVLRGFDKRGQIEIGEVNIIAMSFHHRLSTSCRQMCLTEAKREQQEQFVQSAVKKQQRNKRKREPDMYVAAVLECTVRRICSEVCSSYFCLCTPPKRRKLSTSEEKNETKTIGSSTDHQDLLQTNNLLKSSDYHNPSREIHETFVIPETSQCVPSEESEVENFLHSLTMELTELPSIEEVDELLREIEYRSDLDAMEEEIGALLNSNSDDPFHPGMLEVLFT